MATTRTRYWSGAPRRGGTCRPGGNRLARKRLDEYLHLLWLFVVFSLKKKEIDEQKTNIK